MFPVEFSSLNGKLKLESQNKALSHAFVWAFRDEDKDGEPDYDEAIFSGEDQLSEAFGETDEDGFFSFYLEDAGSYSLRIEMPGELSALSPEPIQFSLKNPADKLKLGNAIKIDWESKVKATTFDIEESHLLNRLTRVSSVRMKIAPDLINRLLVVSHLLIQL